MVEAIGGALAAFFATYDPTQVAIVLAAALFTTTVGALSGFGAMLLLSALLVPLVGVKALVPLTTIASLLMNGSRAWVYRRDLARATIARVLIPALPMSVIGATLYTLLPAEDLLLLIGLFLAAAGPLRRWLERRRFTVTPRRLMVLSAAWGAVRGSLPGTGSLIVPILISSGLRGTALLGTDACVSLGTGLVVSAMFSRFGLLDGPLVILGVLLGLTSIPGAYAARWMIRRMDMRLHTAIVEGAIAVLGLWFVWNWIAG